MPVFVVPNSTAHHPSNATATIILLQNGAPAEKNLGSCSICGAGPLDLTVLTPCTFYCVVENDARNNTQKNQKNYFS